MRKRRMGFSWILERVFQEKTHLAVVPQVQRALVAVRQDRSAAVAEAAAVEAQRVAADLADAHLQQPQTKSNGNQSQSTP